MRAIYKLPGQPAEEIYIACSYPAIKTLLGGPTDELCAPDLLSEFNTSEILVIGLYWSESLVRNFRLQPMYPEHYRPEDYYWHGPALFVGHGKDDCFTVEELDYVDLDDYQVKVLLDYLNDPAREGELL
jgi:hypothetical protein